MEQRCWVNFQCRGVLLVWMIVGQGPIALAVGAGGGCLGIFSLIYLFSFLSPSLWETARYRLKHCLKGPLNPKQPTNQHGINVVTLTKIWFNILCPDGRSKAIPTGHTSLTFKAPITTAADDIHKYFFIVFQRSKT